MDWYNRINTDTLYYVTYSIPDSDVSDFYRWIIGKTKNKIRKPVYSNLQTRNSVEVPTFCINSAIVLNLLIFQKGAQKPVQLDLILPRKNTIF
jgi:hypothetical protein